MKNKMVLSKLIYFAVALSLLVSLVVVGCAPEEAPTAPTVPPPVSTTPTAPTAPTTIPTAPAGIQPQYGGTLRLTGRAGPYNLGFPPQLISTYDMKWVVGMTQEYLFRLDWDLNITPWLATGYTTDYAAKTVTVTLRKGVKFHDGTDFNAEAAKWNLDIAKSEAAAGSEYIRSVDVIDDYTIRINLDVWNSIFFTAIAQNLGGEYSPTAYKEHGREWALTNPVSTGPFAQTYYERGVAFKVKKWEGYWQEGKPYLDAVDVNIIPDDLVRELAFRNKELDAADFIPAKAFAQLAKDGFRVVWHNMPSPSGGLTPDSANPASPFADVRVRQAVAYAIDREGIKQGVYYGVYAVDNGYGVPGQFHYNPDVVGYDYNPTKAKELLAEAGYPTGFKTKIEFIATAGDAQNAGLACQGYLKAVGIDAEAVLSTTAKLMAEGMYGEKWVGLSQVYTRTGAADPLISLIDNWYGKNARVMMVKPRDWLDLVEEAKVAPDVAAKKRALQEATKLMIDKYCMTINYSCGIDSIVYHAWVHDLRFMELGPPSCGVTAGDAWMEPH